MKRIAPIIVTVFLLVMCGSAQQATPDTPASKEDIQRLFVAMHVRERMQIIIDDSRKQSRVFLTDFLLKQVPAAASKREQVQVMVENYLDVMFEDYRVDVIVDESIPIYQRHLTKSEVDAIVGFYSTPVGQKVLQELPAILLESLQAVQSRLQPRLQEATIELTKKLTDMINGEDTNQ